MEKKKAIEKLKAQIEQLKQLDQRGYSSPEFKKWRRDTELAIEHIFGKETRHIIDFRGVNYSPRSYSMDDPESYFVRAFQAGLADGNALLESMIGEIDEYWGSEESAQQDIKQQSFAPSSKVFLVHGRNEKFCEGVARFLEKIDLQPIILHEQPNKGRTIIEKFIDYADVGFAVVLLTADDRGGLISDPCDKYSSRARQNVLLELGFFLGRLGRERVCALYEEGVEIPSDYKGVLFISLDIAGAWRLLLAKEMRAAGLPIDMNRIV